MTEHTSSYYAASANKYAPFDTLNESAIPGFPPRCIWRKRALT